MIVMIVMETNNVPPPFAFNSDTVQVSLSWLVHRLGAIGPIGYGLYRFGGCNIIFLRKDILQSLQTRRQKQSVKSHVDAWSRKIILGGVGMDEFESFRHAPICASGMFPDDVSRFFYPEMNSSDVDVLS